MGKKKQARSKQRKASKKSTQAPSSESASTPHSNVETPPTALVTAETTTAPAPAPVAVNVPPVDEPVEEEKKNARSSAINVRAEIFQCDSDDLEGFLQYVHEKKLVDCFRLQGFLPHAASVLKQNDEELTASFIDWIQDRCMYPYVDYGLWIHFAKEAISFQPNYKVLLGADDIDAFEKAFQQTLDENMDYYFGGDFKESQCYSFELFRDVINKTCEKWGPIFDEKLCHGVPGRFLCECPIYGKPVSKIGKSITQHRDVMECYMSSIFFVGHLLWGAVDSLIAGVPSVHKSCWQCGEDASVPMPEGHKFTVLTCGACNTAIYCSVACQAKAWKKGHKLSCATLESKYKLLRHSLQIVDDRIESGLDLAGIQDYDLLHMAHNVNSPFEDEESSIGGPGMGIFYDNIFQIKSGKFWFVDEPQSMQEYMSCLGEAYKKEMERNHFEKMVATLSYDCLSLIQSGRGLGCVKERFKDEGCKMPPQRFLDLCEDNSFLCCDDSEVVYAAYKPKKVQRVVRKGVLLLFQKTHHKKSDLDELSD